MTFTCKQPELGKTILSLYVVALISILTTSSNPLQPVQTSRDVLQEGGLPDYPTLFSCESVYFCCIFEELGDGFIDQVESSQAWTTMRDNLVMVLTFVEECEMMCALKELVVRGNQCDNGFKSGYLLILENTLATKFPGTGLKIV
ncbi:hypothetical protein ACS0TY_011343 [Phlomoides rotata]